MTAIGALALVDAAELLASADILGALSLDALLGTVSAFDPRIHAGKPHPGQKRSAELLRMLVAGSPLNASHRDCGQVQDAYALRCMPQVHGAVRGALSLRGGGAAIEVNSFTDNPLVLARDDGGFDVISGGNFHGATVAVPIDHMAAALTTLATISERRIDRMMNAGELARAAGLPRRSPGPRERLHDGARDRLGAGQRVQDAELPGQRRHHPDLGRQGGPRQHGPDRGAQAAGGGRQPGARAGDRGDQRGAGDRPAGRRQQSAR
jgi:hypothetical protein